METLELQLDQQKLTRVRQLANDRKCTVEEIVTEAIDRLSNIKDDTLLGLFSNEPEVIDQVVKSAYEARERDQLR